MRLTMRHVKSMRQMRAEGMTYDRIASEVGCSRERARWYTLDVERGLDRTPAYVPLSKRRVNYRQKNREWRAAPSAPKGKVMTQSDYEELKRKERCVLSAASAIEEEYGLGTVHPDDLLRLERDAVELAATARRIREQHEAMASRGSRR